MSNGKKEYPGDEFVFHAADCRAMGWEIPEEIPGCAWVPKAAVKFGKPKITRGEDPDSVELDVDIYFTEPWRWETIIVNISPKKDA